MSKHPKMVICRNCGASIPKQAKICPSCGAKNKKPFYQRWWFILIIIIVIIGIVSSFMENQSEKFDWDELALGERLPEPESNKGSIRSNDSEHLNVHVEKTSRSDYSAYIEECQSQGYTVESVQDGDAYNAFDEEGYMLSLDYIGESMYIELEVPMEMGELNWPKSELANLIPVPHSKIGKVDVDASDRCHIYVGETSEDDFNAYADECSNAGFSIDYERNDASYRAYDANENELCLTYQRNHIMEIQLMRASETESDSNDAQSQDNAEIQEEGVEPEESEENSSSSDEIRPEFKEAMDSYEAFYDEYCAFMKKYNENSGDLKLLGEYSDMLEKLAEMDEKFSAWEEEDLNAAELKYYAEVNGRVTQKLLDIGTE